jgi:hypothetical protein
MRELDGCGTFPRRKGALCCCAVSASLKEHINHFTILVDCAPKSLIHHNRLLSAANRVVGQGSRKTPALFILKKKAASA